MKGFPHSLLLTQVALVAFANPHEKRLLDDLFSDHNKLALPNDKPNSILKIILLFKLIQILDVHEKNQVLKLNGYLLHAWLDLRLSWDPRKYNNISIIHVPGGLVWLPDIILYNNADGSPHVSTITKVTINHSGLVIWEPPVIFNSMCQIDIEWFPFDEQDCDLKFGSWTYHGNAIELLFNPGQKTRTTVKEDGNVHDEVERGIDLSDFQESGEWDLMSVKAIRHRKMYPCCDYPFIDITYYINIRRKTLFHTINLITPCAGIALLSGSVFYLPSDSNNKMVLSVSVLVSIALFFLLLTDIIPPTSLAIPLIAKYLLFTMLLVSFSIGVSVVTINIHYKAGMAYPMSARTRKIFLEFLPKILFVATRRNTSMPKPPKCLLMWANDKSPFGIKAITSLLTTTLSVDNVRQATEEARKIPDEYQRAYENACYIADQMRREDIRNRLKEDWKFVAMVIDRVFLIFYTIAIVFGSLTMFMSAPHMRDYRVPISEIVKAEIAAGNYTMSIFSSK